MQKKVGRPPKKTSFSRQENDISTKNKILLTALRLFAQKGFVETKIQEIVAKSDVNLSMISYYFGGKENLYIACLERAAKESAESIERLLQPPKDIEEFKIRLKIFLEEILLFNTRHEFAMILLRRESLRPSSKGIQSYVENSFFRLVDVVIDYFTHAKKLKFLRSDANPRYLTLLAFGVISGASHDKEFTKLITGTDISDPKFRTTIIETIMKALEPFFITEST